MERKVKSVGWLGALRTSQKNRIGGGGWTGGEDNITVIDFLTIKRKKKVKNLSQRECGTSTTPLWLLVLNSQLYPPPPTQETRESKEKETPIPYPKPGNKIGSPSHPPKGFGERPFLLSPMRLPMEPHSRAQPHS